MASRNLLRDVSPPPLPLSSRVLAGIPPPLPNTVDICSEALPWHTFDRAKGEWAELPPPDALAQMVAPVPGPPQPESSDLSIVTWNVDAIAYEHAERLNSLLGAVKDADAEGCPDIIFLQEVSGIGKRTLAANTFIRNNYYVAGLDWMLNDHNQQFYNATMMSQRRFARGSCMMYPSLGAAWAVWYPSRYNRYALCCDIGAPPRTLDAPPETVRLINVHLDSLATVPSHRPRQLAIVSRMLHARDVVGGLVAGDFNPVLLEDHELVEANGLVDCWTHLRGNAAEFPGFTWGIDGKKQFPPARLDKVAVWGLTPKTMEIVHPGTVPMEVPATFLDASGNEIERDPDDEPSQIPWSDHSGLVMTFALHGDRRESGLGPGGPDAPGGPGGPGRPGAPDAPGEPGGPGALDGSFIVV